MPKNRGDNYYSRDFGRNFLATTTVFDDGIWVRSLLHSEGNIMDVSI